ncbi:hypothetical protein HYPSUDRAFT_41535 [Hypholoma sublateritium FD-334 SS-4]|uniref:Uncharacterized protein n=1 Tax=Hypholoma sublateritium (strain FD-334 SS-4) TaxID=945553 RepID=A0A0D2NSS4_HYPSF|nr:hypothetical protein HYPSUDRAFT_41535 [Hypholoma sublateritium FD-334 SS-4]
MDSLDAVVSLTLAVVLIWKTSDYLENQHFWTLCLRFSTIEHRFTVPSIIVIWIVMIYAFLVQLPPSVHNFRLSIGLVLIAGILLTLLRYVLPAHNNRGYLRLRWKAWSGPSRTGIRAELVPYIGDREDWEHLEALVARAQGTITMYPVERFSRFSFGTPQPILSDPTTILMALASTDNNNHNPWIAQGKTQQGIFQPIIPGKPVSLLWGEFNGFQRRCSRGIISAPKYLLSPYPTLADGVDARGLCLAAGILARNKGLNPASIICNLHDKGMIDIFEQQSVFWPRPAKTLRSIFTRECKHYYSGLGNMFVSVATELALLLTDVPAEIAEDWLNAHLEHQDLELNNTAYTFGARPQELELLYRGQYAAMLVSLSLHRIGIRIRPEVLVYDAVCRSLGVGTGTWGACADMESRRQRELDVLGPRVIPLIEAII